MRFDLLLRRRRLVLAAALLFAVLGASCSSEVRKPVHPTKGKVLHNKTAPAAGALVIFTPTNETDAPKNWPKGFPRATTDKDGAFSLTTYDTGDGIPAGEYVVTIRWMLPTPGDEERDAPDKLGGRYADPQRSRWKVTITEGATQLAPFVVE